MTSGERTFDTTFVICVEAGPMERQAMMLAESLRRWGGRFAKAPLVAVQPRLGPSPNRKTLAFFRNHDVHFRKITPRHGASWDGRLNKSTALSAIEVEADTETITWLDTDIFFADEPELLALGPDEDFTARPECRAIATTGPGDANESYWSEICRSFGVDVESMGWLTSWPEGIRIRSYWQGGVFAYRRTTRLGQAHHNAYLHRLKTRIAHPTAGIVFFDQTSMTMAIRLSNLRCRELDYTHNCNINRLVRSWATPEVVSSTRIIHYHDYMWPEFFDDFLQVLEPARPEVRELIRSYGPLQVSMTPVSRIMRRLLRTYRRYQSQKFRLSCKVY